MVIWLTNVIAQSVQSPHFTEKKSQGDIWLYSSLFPLYDTPTKSFVHRIHSKPLIVEMNALKEKNPLNQIRKENEAHTTIKMAALHCELVYKSTFSGSRE